jgi:hypothetical protein
VRAQIVHGEDPIAPAHHTDLPRADTMIRMCFIGKSPTGPKSTLMH